MKKQPNSLGRVRPKWGEGSPHSFSRRTCLLALWTKQAQPQAVAPTLPTELDCGAPASLPHSVFKTPLETQNRSPLPLDVHRRRGAA